MVPTCRIVAGESTAVCATAAPETPQRPPRTETVRFSEPRTQRDLIIATSHARSISSTVWRLFRAVARLAGIGAGSRPFQPGVKSLYDRLRDELARTVRIAE